MFQRCADHKIIIMPLLPTVILFIDTDITARNNVDKYCNTEIIFSLEDLSFFSFCILHCSVYIIVVYKLKYQARKNFSFQNIIKNQPSFVAIFKDDLILIAIFEDVINSTISYISLSNWSSGTSPRHKKWRLGL